jgi:hypothetical protein
MVDTGIITITQHFGGRFLASGTHTNGVFNGFLPINEPTVLDLEWVPSTGLTPRFGNYEALLVTTATPGTPVTLSITPISTQWSCFPGCGVPVPGATSFAPLTGSDVYNANFTFPLPVGTNCLVGSTIVGGLAPAACVALTGAPAPFCYKYSLDFTSGNLTLSYIGCTAAATNGYPRERVSAPCDNPPYSTNLVGTLTSLTCYPFAGTWTFSGGNTSKVFGTDPATVTMTE